MFIRFSGDIINMAKFKSIYKLGINRIEITDDIFELFSTEKERDERFTELENSLCGALSDKVLNVQAVDKDKDNIYIIDINGQPKQKGCYYVKYQHSSDFNEDVVRRWDGTEWSYCDGGYTNFGNYSTRGEKYKLKELDSNQ